MLVLLEDVAQHACVLPGKSQEAFSRYKAISCAVFTKLLKGKPHSVTDE